MTDYFEKALLSEIEEMTIIDAHSHLPEEAQELDMPTDIFNRILTTYTLTNARMADAGIERDWIKNPEIPLKERWARFSPVYPLIKESGYVRVARYCTQELYGCDIGDDTYEYISQKCAEQNKPGLFEDILWNRCKIETVINQGTWKKGGRAVSINRDFLGLIGKSHSYKWLQELYGQVREAGYEPAGYEQLLHALFEDKVLSKGFKGVKFSASLQRQDFSPQEKDRYFELLRSGRIDMETGYALGMMIVDDIMALCGEHGLIVAVHCGLNWDGGDFYHLQPRAIVPFVEKHRNTKFDIYHASIPWVRETGVLANQFENVYLNLTWAHQISPFMVVNSLNEWLDLVPANKIMACGTDASLVEKVYGALRITRENIAMALAERARVTGFSLADATQYCKLWFYDNPKELYRL